MSVLVELKHLLLQVLPSPAMMVQGRSLCIQNQLAMICDSLWAINSMIIIPDMVVLYRNYLQWIGHWDPVLDVPTEFANWKIDVTAAVADVGGLLDRILNCEPSLHRSILGNTQSVHFRHVILVELKETLCNLNSLVLRGSAMGLRRDPMESMNPLEEDYSIVLKNEVMDREEDLETLIAFIQQQQLVSFNNNSDDSNPFVIVIVGEQGVGKMTLAHMIYHHTWVCQQFHHRIWVDLPAFSTFKMINIIGKEFARSINNEEYCDRKLQLEQSLQAMWEYINEQLDGSRYLLVLHCENLNSLTQQEWHELKNILLCVGGAGSAVLVILKSSIEELSSDMGFLNGVKDITTYCLNPLSEDASLELFKRHATTTFPPWKQDKSKKDELILFAKQHLQSLICQPLLEKIVASLGHDIRATSGDRLTDFLKDIYRLKGFPLFLVRLQQYRHLLDVDTRNDNYNVILHMLTAECLIRAEGFESGWIERYDKFCIDIDLTYLPEFMFPRMVYLHMEVPEDSTNVPRSCRYLCLEINPRAMPFRLPTIPDEVNDKLIALILQEDEETPLGVCEKRHKKVATAILKFLTKMSIRLVHLHILVVESSMIQRLPSEISKLANLRYLHLSKLKMELLPKSLFELPNLRILSLLRCGKLQKIPERIRKLKKLQILKVAYCTKLQRLPKSITALKNLEVLNMEGCCWLSELPEDLVCFKSLKILDITRCTSLSQMPRGMEQLIGLRKLSGIFVGVDGGFGLAQLQALTNLQEIKLRNLEAIKDTQTEVLMGQQNLLELSLHWDGEEANESNSELVTPLQILEALRPNVHLRKLEIISYKGVEFPIWMSKQQLARFDSLVEVRLINLRSCATLPSLGQLPHLETLEISGMNLTTHIDDTFYSDGGIFPMLRDLIFSEMLALEKWSIPKRTNAELFPRLEELRLIQCPKLKEIDRLCDSSFAMGVWLNNNKIWSAEFCNWDNLRCIIRIEIVGCQELMFLPQGMQSLKHLTKMTIISCNNLTTLVALDSLLELRLYSCPVLEFKVEAFTGLYYMEIKGCPNMQIYNDNAWRKKTDELQWKKIEELRWKQIEELQWKEIKEQRKKIEELQKKEIGEQKKKLKELQRKEIEEFERKEKEELQKKEMELWREEREELEKKEIELWREEIEELQRQAIKERRKKIEKLQINEIEKQRKTIKKSWTKEIQELYRKERSLEGKEMELQREMRNELRRKKMKYPLGFEESSWMDGIGKHMENIEELQWKMIELQWQEIELQWKMIELLRKMIEELQSQAIEEQRKKIEKLQRKETEELRRKEIKESHRKKMKLQRKKIEELQRKEIEEQRKEIAELQRKEIEELQKKEIEKQRKEIEELERKEIEFQREMAEELQRKKKKYLLPLEMFLRRDGTEKHIENIEKLQRKKIELQRKKIELLMKKIEEKGTKFLGFPRFRRAKRLAFRDRFSS